MSKLDYPTGWFTSISVLTTYCYKAQQWTGCMCVTTSALIDQTVGEKVPAAPQHSNRL